MRPIVPKCFIVSLYFTLSLVIAFTIVLLKEDIKSTKAIENEYFVDVF